MSLYAHELDIGLGPMLPVHWIQSDSDTFQKNEHVLQSQQVQSHWTLDLNLPDVYDSNFFSPILTLEL